MFATEAWSRICNTPLISLNFLRYCPHSWSRVCLHLAGEWKTKEYGGVNQEMNHCHKKVVQTFLCKGRPETRTTFQVKGRSLFIHKKHLWLFLSIYCIHISFLVINFMVLSCCLSWWYAVVTAAVWYWWLCSKNVKIWIREVYFQQLCAYYYANKTAFWEYICVILMYSMSVLCSVHAMMVSSCSNNKHHRFLTTTFSVQKNKQKNVHMLNALVAGVDKAY